LSSADLLTRLLIRPRAQIPRFANAKLDMILQITVPPANIQLPFRIALSIAVIARVEGFDRRKRYKQIQRPQTTLRAFCFMPPLLLVLLVNVPKYGYLGNG
jgi:hypothetical protein